MSISENNKVINNELELKKAEYDYIDKMTAEISALLWRNVSKFEILTGKDVLQEKDLLEKIATMKRFGYSPLDKELKAETDIAEKQYQKLNNTYDSEKNIWKRKTNIWKI